MEPSDLRIRVVPSWGSGQACLCEQAWVKHGFFEQGMYQGQVKSSIEWSGHLKAEGLRPCAIYGSVGWLHIWRKSVYHVTC